MLANIADTYITYILPTCYTKEHWEMLSPNVYMIATTDVEPETRD